MEENKNNNQNSYNQYVRKDQEEDWRKDVKAPPPDLRPKTEDVTNTRGQEWDDFVLKKELLMGIVSKGFDMPSPIQEEAIPQILAKKNIIARAKNGTGKTGSFVIPMQNHIDENKNQIQALVLVPTRELALQTSSVIKDLGKYMNIDVVVSTGGTSLREDIMRQQKNVHIVVATPGRILDLAGKGVADLSQCGIFILDEADKQVSEDFQPIVLRQLEFCQKNPQILLFSATYPATVANFLKAVPDVQKINLMTELTLKGMSQFYAYIEERQKLHCQNTLFGKLNIQQAIIFCNSALRVELLAKKILELNYSCYFIHAKMQQNERNKVFHNFRKGNCRCLVSSDLFTRGIDIPTVNVVVNFDFPKQSETYLHRVGRGGRYGHRGQSINFITNQDKENLMKIEQELDTEIQPLPKEIDSNLY